MKKSYILEIFKKEDFKKRYISIIVKYFDDYISLLGYLKSNFELIDLSGAKYKIEINEV